MKAWIETVVKAVAEKLLPDGLTAWVISRIRTFVPIGVGVAMVWVETRLHVDLDDPTISGVAVAVTSGLYYELARRLERRWPKWGWLLGYPAQPAYER